MICFPNAKINLGLNIISKRADGFHNIETIFYPIALKDALEIIPSNNKRTYRLFQTGIDIHSKAGNNLVIKALSILGEQKYIPNIDIHLFKNIPSGAGLGGGSSNAAFMLKLLNQTFSLDFTDDELAQIAIKLGADCAFFLKNKPVFAHGIGEKLEDVNLSLEEYFLVVVKPYVSVSTIDAYAKIIPKQPVMSLREIVKRPINEWRTLMQNDFEVLIIKKYPAIGEIKQYLYENGAEYASMSGSGTSVYGLFKKKPDIIFSDRYPDYFVWKNYI